MVRLVQYSMNQPIMRFALWSNIALMLVATACDEQSIDSPVPQYNVSCSISLATEGGTEPGAVALSVMGGWCTIRQWTTLTSNLGVCGLLVCHDLFDERQYHAYDLCCPYCYQQSNHSNLQPTEMQLLDESALGYGLVCPACESEFGYVLQGIPSSSKGPANAANVNLRRYKAYQAGEVVYVVK